jgi:8-oxo-dGTP diphosphatase
MEDISPYPPDTPYLRVELCVFGLQDGKLSVLLSQRAQLPHRGQWALAGDVIRVGQDQSLEAAAHRVARERLRVAIPYLRQDCAVGGSGRDQRAKFTLSVVYRALIRAEHFDPSPGHRTSNLQWRTLEGVVGDHTIAFDHAQIIQNAAAALRKEVRALEIPVGILSPNFTLSELQVLCEQILGQQLDKASFRRRVEAEGFLEPAEGFRLGAFRPAQLYRLKRLPS